MISNKHLICAAASLAGWAALAFFDKQRKTQKIADKKLHQSDLSTWEGEGGNLLPATKNQPDNQAIKI